MALGSCSVYRSGQTPDDVYYSPARPAVAASYADAGNERDGQYYSASGDRYSNPYHDNNSYYDPYATDYWLRMRAHNPYRWSTFDDYYYYGNDWRFNPLGYNMYNPYHGLGSSAYYGLGAGFGLGVGGYWNNYYGWNSFYNPYYYNAVVASPKQGNYFYNQLRNNVRPVNVRSYTNRMYNNGNFRVNNHNSYSPAPQYNNSNFGNNYRQASPNNPYNNNSYERPSRTYIPSTTPSYSPAPSGGSSGGSGVTRPGRG